MENLARSDVERQVIGRLLACEGRGAIELRLSPVAFEDPAMRAAWSAIRDLVAGGNAADLQSVACLCLVRDQRVIGEIARAASAAPSGGNLEMWADELRKIAVAEARRRIVTEGACALASGTDSAEVSAKITGEIAEAEAALGVNRECCSVAVANELLQSISEGRDSGSVRTGVGPIDDLCIGLLHGDYVVLAARPSVGKTAFALSMLQSMARSGVRSVFVSLEMSARSVIGRILAAISGRSTKVAMRNPAMVSDESRAEIVASASDLLDVLRYIEIRDDPVVDVEQIAPIARDAVNRGAKILVCDYLQLMRGEGKSRDQQVETLSRDWKRLLKELKVPGIMLSQLNRESERDNRMPRLSDLRNSGAIEQDADIIWFLHRPKPESGEIQVIQSKGRDVGIGRAELFFDGKTQRFAPLDRRPAW